ncbi:PP2C family protein-serine/threonine phosphatase [Streptomyces sp. NPDC056704]|uniref:PP2C family protein-serine/threonine phosphatase n=1 Tax=Streptomyces TaxID=1883 RepID=UPI0036914921
MEGERERLAALRRYDAVGSPAEQPFGRVAALAARWFDVPFATVAFVDAERVWFKGAHGLPGLTDLPREAALCAAAILHQGPYVVCDTLLDPLATTHPLVVGESGMRFYAAVPITTADGYRLGTVAVWDTRPRKVTEAELATLEDLAAVVMDELEVRQSARTTVRAERRMRRRAETDWAESEVLAAALERMLAPPELPTIPGLELASALRMAAPRQIGGDFYEVFPLSDGRWVFMLGDVCGKGALAASLTALIRHTVRAEAAHDPDPVAMLTALNQAMLAAPAQGRPGFCTLVLGLLEPVPASGRQGGVGGFRVTVGGGGHPPVYVLRAGGGVEGVRPEGGMLVGALADAAFSADSLELGPGDVLLLYTDGLTEARRPDGRLFGEEGLTAFLGSCTGLGAREATDCVIALVEEFGSAATDDVAVMTLAVPP